MSPLKIALMMLEPPNPFGNAAGRWYYVLLKELVARGHIVKAIAACSKPEEIPLTQALFPAPMYHLKLYEFPDRSGLRSKIETLQRPHSYMFSKALKRAFDDACATSDIVHLEQLWCAWLCDAAAANVVVNIHYLSGIDLEFVRPPTWKGRFLQSLRNRAESRLVRKHLRFIALSERLKERLLRIQPRASVSVVPLGIDCDLYDYIPDERRTREPVVGLIGSMGWYPSQTAAVRLLETLWPRIRERVPNVRLQIVGYDAVRALAKYTNLPNVSISENVPETRPYFESTSVMLYAPGRGSGMKVKIMEALAYGIPVVTTNEGVEGLPALDGIHAGIADDDDGLVHRTVQLLASPELQNRMRIAGRKLVEEHCGSRPTVDRIETVYDVLLRHHVSND